MARALRRALPIALALTTAPRVGRLHGFGGGATAELDPRRAAHLLVRAVRQVGVGQAEGIRASRSRLLAEYPSGAGYKYSYFTACTLGTLGTLGRWFAVTRCAPYTLKPGGDYSQHSSTQTQPALGAPTVAVCCNSRISFVLEGQVQGALTVDLHEAARSGSDLFRCCEPRWARPSKDEFGSSPMTRHRPLPPGGGRS